LADSRHMRFTLLFAVVLVAGLLVVSGSTAAEPAVHPLKLRHVSHRSVVLGEATAASLR
jgi:hypothetical protein